MYAEHGKHPREALFYAVSRVVLIVYIIRRDMHSASIMYVFTSDWKCFFVENAPQN